MTASLHNNIASLLPRLRRFVRSQREDAHDLVQLAVGPVLGRSAQRPAGFRLDRSMFRVIEYTWIDAVRGRIRRERVFAPEPDGAHAGDDCAAAQQDRMAVQQATSLFSHDQRIVIGLVLFDGLSYKQAAEVLGIAAVTLAGRLARAAQPCKDCCPIKRGPYHEIFR